MKFKALLCFLSIGYMINLMASDKSYVHQMEKEIREENRKKFITGDGKEYFEDFISLLNILLEQSSVEHKKATDLAAQCWNQQNYRACTELNSFLYKMSDDDCEAKKQLIYKEMEGIRYYMKKARCDEDSTSLDCRELQQAMSEQQAYYLKNNALFNCKRIVSLMKLSVYAFETDRHFRFRLNYPPTMAEERLNRM